MTTAAYVVKKMNLTFMSRRTCQSNIPVFGIATAVLATWSCIYISARLLHLDHLFSFTCMHLLITSKCIEQFIPTAVNAVRVFVHLLCMLGSVRPSLTMLCLEECISLVLVFLPLQFFTVAFICLHLLKLDLISCCLQTMTRIKFLKLTWPTESKCCFLFNAAHNISSVMHNVVVLWKAICACWV